MEYGIIRGMGWDIAGICGITTVSRMVTHNAAVIT